MTARKSEREGLAEGVWFGAQTGLCEQDGQHGQRDSVGEKAHLSVLEGCV